MRSNEERHYWVYMLTNSSHRVLYTGVTNHLERRLREHREGLGGSFTKKYKASKLVYAESTPDVVSAIAREKQIKGWLRSKKNTLIATINPQWHDLEIAWSLADNTLPCHPEQREGSRLSTTLDSSLRSE